MRACRFLAPGIRSGSRWVGRGLPVCGDRCTELFEGAQWGLPMHVHGDSDGAEHRLVRQLRRDALGKLFDGHAEHHLPDGRHMCGQILGIHQLVVVDDPTDVRRPHTHVVLVAAQVDAAAVHGCHIPRPPLPCSHGRICEEGLGYALQTFRVFVRTPAEAVRRTSSTLPE